MEDSIVEKLSTLLQTPIDSEYKVVYLLAQLRKLSEQQNTSGDYFSAEDEKSLKLYANWVLHAKLEKKNTVYDFMKVIDEWVGGLGERDSIGEQRSIIIQQEIALVFEMAFKGSLKKELSKFLKKNQIISIICDDSKWWEIFISQLDLVIEHFPLTYQKDMKHITQVKLSKTAAGITVIIDMKNGSQKHLNIDESPSGDEFGSFGDSLIYAEYMTEE